MDVLFRASLAAFAASFAAGCGPSAVEASVLIYNVAGLPEGLSKSDPERNHPKIGVRINAYDLVLVQEDFAYHDLLSTGAKHPFRSEPKEHEALVGDGLNRFSIYELGPLERVQWAACNGQFDASSDCLSEKGYSVGRVVFGEDLAVHVFNLHMDAGGGEDDDAARAVQIDQLLEAVAARAGEPMIVGGDTNLHVDDALDAPRLSQLEAAGLVDACSAVGCGDDRIDRFFFMSGDEIVVRPLDWRLPDEFTDADGGPLSDHEPVAVRFAIERR